MLNNKHVLAALIITPILAILGYFAVDLMVSETPHKAVKGGTYELVARSNCRYASGHCVMGNGDFKIDLQGEVLDDGRLRLSMKSAFPLQGGKVAAVNNRDQTGVPQQFVALDNSQQQWVVITDNSVNEHSVLQLVVSARDTLYFGETGLAFTEYHSSVDKELRGD